MFRFTHTQYTLVAEYGYSPALNCHSCMFANIKSLQNPVFVKSTPGIIWISPILYPGGWKLRGHEDNVVNAKWLHLGNLGSSLLGPALSLTWHRGEEWRGHTAIWTQWAHRETSNNNLVWLTICISWDYHTGSFSKEFFSQGAVN